MDNLKNVQPVMNITQIQPPIKIKPKTGNKKSRSRQIKIENLIPDQNYSYDVSSQNLLSTKTPVIVVKNID